MARVLITGGAGYVGGWLADRAVEAGHDVRVYDLLLYEDRYLKPVPFIAGDILDRGRFAPHLEWADTVVWLAGLVGDPACALEPMLTKKINVDTIHSLCDDFAGRIIFPSTCSVYGAQDEELDEVSPTNPLSLYAETKLEAEQILHERRPESLMLRLATLAGVGDTYSRIRLDLVVNLLVVRARLIGELEVFGGNQYSAAASRARRGHGDRAPPGQRRVRDLQPRDREHDDPRARPASGGARGSGRDPHRRRAVPGHAQLPGLVRASPP